MHTHNCSVTYDGDEIATTSPMSMLDCDKPKCRQRAETARRGTSYTLEAIRTNLAEAEDRLITAADTVDLWKLILEAKERTTETPTYEHHFITNDGPIFNMIEDESGDIFWGYGHQDPTVFVNEIMRWLQHVGAGPEPGEPHPSGLAEQSVEYLWARMDDEHGERFSIVGSEDDGAFPVTRLWL